MRVTLLQVPAASEASGELEIENRRGAHRAHLLRRAPCLQQPVHPCVVEQIDGAKFVQRA